MNEITKRAAHISDAKFYANELLKANHLDSRFEARTTAPKKGIFAEEVGLFDKTNNQLVRTLGRAKNAEESIEAFVRNYLQFNKEASNANFLHAAHIYCQNKHVAPSWAQVEFIKFATMKITIENKTLFVKQMSALSYQLLDADEKVIDGVSY